MQNPKPLTVPEIRRKAMAHMRKVELKMSGGFSWTGDGPWDDFYKARALIRQLPKTSPEN